MITYMKKIRKILRFFTDLSNNLDELVKVTTPSNYKTLLDISSKLYDDEISRYRFLEDKSSRFLALISFLLPANYSILYWVYSKNNDLFSLSMILIIFLSLIAILLSLGYVLVTYSITNKPALEIPKDYIEHIDNNDDVSYNKVYFDFINFYCESINEYRLANTKKAKHLKYAHRFLIAYFLCASFIMATILISLVVNPNLI